MRRANIASALSYLKIMFLVVLGCKLDRLLIVDPACIHSCHVDLRFHIILEKSSKGKMD